MDNKEILNLMKTMSDMIDASRDNKDILNAMTAMSSKLAMSIDKKHKEEERKNMENPYKTVTFKFYRIITKEEYERFRTAALEIINKVKRKYLFHPITKHKESMVCDDIKNAIENDLYFNGHPWFYYPEFFVESRYTPHGYYKPDDFFNGSFYKDDIKSNGLPKFLFSDYYCDRDYERGIFIKLKKEIVFNVWDTENKYHDGEKIVPFNYLEILSKDLDDAKNRNGVSFPGKDFIIYFVQHNGGRITADVERVKE